MSSSSQASDSLKSTIINGETFFKIENSDRLRPFFMSIVSASNHWMFIGSNGGLTAGRKNSEFALFPYYSDDKIIESTEVTGPKTIVRLTVDGKLVNWEPFGRFGKEKFSLSRNLYKNEYGNKVVFEEVNHDLSISCIRNQSNVSVFRRCFESGSYPSSEFHCFRHLFFTTLLRTCTGIDNESKIEFG